ncbi:hypothetical protein EYF80_053227 [Liparis tanakae]|uniref:Uncharacterized protein n=1 Tax=Liparis tanakae TaxID=230148 RepID=A0A4Z2F5U9_9TELE|nr:hypothetical protein EYF80_053227 [Liparis tanakae]
MRRRSLWRPAGRTPPSGAADGSSVKCLIVSEHLSTLEIIPPSALLEELLQPGVEVLRVQPVLFFRGAPRGPEGGNRGEERRRCGDGELPLHQEQSRHLTPTGDPAGGGRPVNMR